MHEEVVELGHLVAPDRPGIAQHPGVVLIHDVWGLQDHPRDLARRLAAEGFSVLAIDLYRREEALEIRDAGAWMRGLSDPQVLADLQSAVDFLSTHACVSASGAGRVAITGFCMGGMYALMAGGACRGVAAVAPFYGILSHAHGLLHTDEPLDPALKPREPLTWAAELRCPLLGFFGGKDDFVPLSDVESLRAALKTSGQPHEVRVYPEAGHAFVNDTRPDAWRPDDAADAWQRLVAFLHERLS